MANKKQISIGTKYHIENDVKRPPPFRNVADIPSMKYSALALDDTTLLTLTKFNNSSFIGSIWNDGFKKTFDIENLKQSWRNSTSTITTSIKILDEMRKLSPFPFYTFLVLSLTKIGNYHLLQRMVSKKGTQSAWVALLVSTISSHCVGFIDTWTMSMDDALSDRHGERACIPLFKHLKSFNNIPLKLVVPYRTSFYILWFTTKASTCYFFIYY